MKNHVKELTEGMQRLCAVANRIVAEQGKANRIDVDLLLEDLRRLYDVALQMEEGLPAAKEGQPAFGGHPQNQEEKMMAMMSTMAAMQKPEPEPVVEPKPTPEPEPDPEPIPEPEPAPEPAPEPEPVEMPQMEELEQNDNALLFDEVIIEPEPAPEPTPEPTPEPVVPEPPVSRQASLLDYLNQPVATVGEQPYNTQRTLGNTQRTLGATQRTLGESLGADRPQPNTLERKVDDLRSVININDKFSFMSELFHNNMKAYNDFIMHLNALEDREEALAHVRDVAAQQKWDDESATVQAFYKIFDKKF